MSGTQRIVAAGLVLLLAGCGGPGGQESPDDVGTRESGPAAASARDTASGSAAAEARPGQPGQPGQGMPMGGRMSEMHARMMGGGSAEDVRAVEAAQASAPGCPDIDQALVDRGQQVFAGPGVCYTCHAGDGTGTQLAPDLTDGEWLNVEGSYASIAEVVRTGVSQPQQFPAPMPPMGGASLSEDQICAVAAYVYSLSR